MRKYLIAKKSHQLIDNIKIEQDNNEEIETNLGTIHLNDRQLGNKKKKPRFNNNPNKVLMKRR